MDDWEEVARPEKLAELRPETARPVEPPAVEPKAESAPPPTTVPPAWRPWVPPHVGHRLALAFAFLASLLWAGSAPAASARMAAEQQAQAWRVNELEGRVRTLEHEVRSLRALVAASAAAAPPAAVPASPPLGEPADAHDGVARTSPLPFTADGAVTPGRKPVVLGEKRLLEEKRLRKQAARRRRALRSQDEADGGDLERMLASDKTSESVGVVASAASPTTLATPKMAEGEWSNHVLKTPKKVERRIAKWERKLLNADDDGAGLLAKWERKLAHAQNAGHDEKARTLLMKIKSVKRKLGA